MPKKLFLSDTDRKIAGVCGGIADFLGWDSTIVRILMLLLAFCVGGGFLAYLIIWAVAPRESTVGPRAPGA